MATAIPAITLLAITAAPPRCRRLFHYRDPRRAAEAVRPGLDQRQGGRVVAYASGSLHAHLRPDGFAHQLHVGYGCPGGAEACGGLHEIEARRLCDPAREDFLFIGEVAGLDDDLRRDSGLRRAHGGEHGAVAFGHGELLDGRSIGERQVDRVERPVEFPDVDHEVEFVSAVAYGVDGLSLHGCERALPKREADDGSDPDARAGHEPRGIGDLARVDHHASEVPFDRLAAKTFDGVSRAVGLEERVVDHRRQRGRCRNRT